MSDVYLVYARENRSIAEKIFTLLSKQWEVWWDDNIVGDYGQVISANIAKTKCIVALFSSHAHKITVTDELRLGEQHKKQIIPLVLDDSEAPYPFGRITSIDFRNWNQEADHPDFQLLQRKLNSVVPAPKSPERLFAAGKLPIPNAFMSVSSYETRFKPAEALQLLKVHPGTQSILVSAYDLVNSSDRKQMIEEIHEFHEHGGFVLIDSGNYEADRLEDKRWNPAKFKEALLSTPHDWAFCFDNMKPSSDPNNVIEDVVKSVKRDSKHTKAPVLPIVHVTQDEEGLTNLPTIIRCVSERLHPPLIAIPERELGAGLARRAKTMREIRQELNRLPYYQPVHLLGTGNPRSIAVLVAAGADTFDGLEWCRFAVDSTRGSLDHFQHLDFLKDKAARTPFLEIVDGEGEIGYAGKVALYNLEYYAEFGNLMRKMIYDKEDKLFAIGIIRDITPQKLKQVFPEIFS